eukprot:2548116-Karenia_brevis.AAC.1
MSAEDADAASAYTQADLGGPPTWITLPKDRWPREWFGQYDTPVDHLRKPLYGHPSAGLYWEQHYHDVLIQTGWQKVRGWEC